MWKEYISAGSLEEVARILSERGDRARIVAGATDLILELERGVRKGIDTLVDVTRIAGLDQIIYDQNGRIHLGPLVTHNHCVESKMIRDHAYPLARACWEVGSPQIRNRGTVVGNVVTASPANDTITPLMALDARLILQSVRGNREVSLSEFYTGVRQTVLAPDEFVADIFFPALNGRHRSTFIKFALRQAQAISLVNAAVVLQMQGALIQAASITLGAVTPTIVHAQAAEDYLAGQILDKNTIERASELALEAARPISDIRGSAQYRRRMVQVLVRRGLRSIANGVERVGMPEEPVLLWGNEYGNSHRLAVARPGLIASHEGSQPIITRINGREYQFTTGHNKTLLRLLREEAGLIGSKEGCAEGECGACTVFLDGQAVMSCMVLAPRAHGADIVTIEGLPENGVLHPVQRAFIETGAVQCGYCTPGFIMSGVKLLEERPNPSQDEIKQAFTGNLCRCTGYYNIIKAIEKAVQMENTMQKGVQ